MSALSALRARLARRSDSEHEQAILRIVIVSIVLAWMAVLYDPTRDDKAQHGLVLLGGLSAVLLFGIALFAWICLSPARNVPRRLIGSIADNAASTFVMFMTTEAGVAMVGVYLFVAFGNGFRYGRRYLFFSQSLALAGFGAVLLLDAHWSRHQIAGWSLYVSLVVLPLYVSTLLKRVTEAQRRAEEANVAKTTFLANMSHEMRTPLNGIVGVADLLRATKLDRHQQELARLLSHSVLLLRSLVDDVLDISKIESGRISIALETFDLHATVNGLVALLRPHARQKGLALRASIDSSLDYRLTGDEHHLRQVLLNLMSNALKFTERGAIAVTVEAVGETAEGYRVRFAVTDTGIGIAPAARERIFERFVQADDSTTRRFGGTGLGTTIAKQLVELMGGTIGVESAPGEGSTFWFEVPLLKAAAAEGDTGGRGAALVAGDAAGNAAADALAPLFPQVRQVRGVDEVAHEMRALRQRGSDVRAVIVSGDEADAGRLFEQLAAQDGGRSVAMIYVSDDPRAREREPLRRFEALQVVPRGFSARQIRNALHAATASGGTGRAADVIDLAAALEQQRRPLSILVAEDNATNLTILRHLLESAGHSVIEARDGEEALDRYEQASPDLAILDYNMPERNGLEVVAAIRAMEPPGTRIPLLILSASVTPDARERARSAGADEFVGKPFDAGQLLQTLDRMAARSSRKAAAEAPPPVTRAILHAAPRPLVDAERLEDLRRIGSSETFLDQLTHGFAADVEALLARIDAAIAARESSAVADALHAVRGAAVGIGAAQLAERSAAMEDVAAQGDLARLHPLAAELRACHERTLAELERRRALRHAGA